jgi:hypothetical protein
MPGHPSPAIRFHDVTVANDQTGARWHAPVASIRNGRIVVSGRPPDGFFDSDHNTFTITADDGGGRKRQFPLLALDAAYSKPPDEYAFT